jgi:hypothetical protein
VSRRCNRMCTFSHCRSVLKCLVSQAFWLILSWHDTSPKESDSYVHLHDVFTLYLAHAPWHRSRPNLLGQPDRSGGLVQLHWFDTSVGY